jgi:hypothetical protein
MKLGSLLVAISLLVPHVTAIAVDKGARPAARPGGAAAGDPAVSVREHRVGNIRFGVSNWGFIGSQGSNERISCAHRYAYSLEYPKRSGVNYLYQGALWVGAVKGNDTLVSTGADGWYSVFEMFPPPASEGDFIERTTREVLRAEQNTTCPDVYFSYEAISEQDLIAVYTDTLTDAFWVFDDAFDGPHHPLGVSVTQRSYAWSYDYARDFVIVEWTIDNIGPDPLGDVRVGLFIDPDVGHPAMGEIFNDDICGYIGKVPSLVGLPGGDDMNMMWAADNDGDPMGASFQDGKSATGVLGVRLLKTTTNLGPVTFNWWSSSGNRAYDWGPNKRNSDVIYLSGNLGTPEGDKAKYAQMGNGEFDYDQIESALDHQADGWLPPLVDPTMQYDMAGGRDIYMLMSTGQLDLAPGDSVSVTAALVAGPGFHRDPQNFVSYFDGNAPRYFKERLEFSGLIRNARWAGWVYDNPGRDTDGNGYRGQYVAVDGDTLYYTGDGVPDFRGPDAPPSPQLYFHTSPGRIVVRWNGRDVEAARDAFTHVRDFEGYRVYMGSSMELHDFAFLAEREQIDFIRYDYDLIGERWSIGAHALTLDSLKARYDSLSLDQRGYPFHPDSFADTSLAAALWLTTVDPADPTALETHYYAFAPYGDNVQIDDAALYFAVSAGANVVRVIRKPYPFAAPDDTMWRDDGAPFLPYYEYEYAVDELYPGEPVYMAVTCYDFGDPPSGVAPTEGHIYDNYREVWPVAAGFATDSLPLVPGVYPNPYRVMDDYVGQGYERLDDWFPNPEYSRQMVFYNLPETCTVSIWTLDGDLVRELRHVKAPGNPQATFEVWDLINRNQDIITHGLYIYSVESRSGTYVGKLAILR